MQSLKVGRRWFYLHARSRLIRVYAEQVESECVRLKINTRAAKADLADAALLLSQLIQRQMEPWGNESLTERSKHHF